MIGSDVARRSQHVTRVDRSATHDWGVVGEPHFDRRQLATMKGECEPNCFSTLNHIVSWCYDDGRIIRWMLKQARHGFQSIHGNFD